MQTIYLGQNGWWLLPILLLSVGMGFFLYSKKNVPWGKTQNWLLFCLRSIAVFLILFLLLEPEIKQTINKTIPPAISLHLDNSESMVARGESEADLKERMDQITTLLASKGIETELFQLDEKDSILFDQKASKLTYLMGKSDDAMGYKNHVASILISDGIYNAGISPAYKNYLKPVFTIGTGDTIPPRDVSISRIRNNKVVFNGNKTPIEVEVSQNGFEGETIEVRLTKAGNVLETKDVKMQGSFAKVSFLYQAEHKGLQQLKVKIAPKEGEFTLENNEENLFLDVVEAEQHILIVANGPHPDIKALRTALGQSGNYQIDLYLKGITEKKEKQYDLVIVHGAFSSNLSWEAASNPGIWYILNTESNLRALKNEAPFLTIKKKGNNPDQVGPSLNTSFSKFKLTENQTLRDFPPIEVPFADYDLNGPVEVLLHQKIGSVKTKRPLMVIYDDGQTKKAITMGEGLWRWRLLEKAINGNASFVDELITKTAQFLSIKANKKRFRVTPQQTTFSNNSSISFGVEVYNDLFEQVYGNEIKLEVFDSEGNRTAFDFKDSELNTILKIPARQEGLYTYKASVKYGGKSFDETGEFIVEEVNAEMQNLTADHKLLKRMAAKSNGAYFHIDEVQAIEEELERRNFKSIITSDDRFFPLIQNLWYFFAIFLLLSVEWFLRKYWGGY